MLPKRDNDLITLYSELYRLSSNTRACALAATHGLEIVDVSWDDTARTKGTVYGPNISDVTLFPLLKNLSSEGLNMPMIRPPKLADKTCDMPISKFTVTVGNENGTELTRIPLMDYLKNASKYMTGFQQDTSKTKEPLNDAKQPAEDARKLIESESIDLYRDRDSAILTRFQTAMLPLEKGEVEFNVRLHNYQTRATDPAVLVIVASSQGTSAQVITGYQQRIFFNHKGDAANFLAQRLSEDRQLRGKEIEGKMDKEEQDRNVLFIYQVPLKQKQVIRTRGSNKVLSFSCENSDNGISLMSTAKGKRKSMGVEHAMLSASAVHSKFKGTEGLTLVRDDRYPICCTVQYYRVTGTIDIPETVYEEIADKMRNAYKQSLASGSLVFSDPDKQKSEDVRVTEPILPKPEIPPQFTDSNAPILATFI